MFIVTLETILHKADLESCETPESYEDKTQIKSVGLKTNKDRSNVFTTDSFHQSVANEKQL